MGAVVASVTVTVVHAADLGECSHLVRVGSVERARFTWGKGRQLATDAIMGPDI